MDIMIVPENRMVFMLKDIPRDMHIWKLKEMIKERIGCEFDEFELLFKTRILNDFDKTLEFYGVKNRNRIRLIGRAVAGGGDPEHLCPYGCGRMIPDKFKGCTELLQAYPNYFN